jgi:endonuclease YncB( thermonuclease family)
MAAAWHFMVNDVKLPQYRRSRAFRFKSMKMRICLACTSAALVIAAIGVARADGACRFEVLGTGKVAKVVDGRNFVMEDGREVRIAGIEAPPAPAAGEPRTPLTNAGIAAKAALAAILLDQAIELRGREHVTDRYGRTVAFVERVNDAVAAAGEMLALGHARVAAQVGDTACAVELLSRERVARAGKLGLWAEPYYEVIEARHGSQLLAARGHFTLVEGRVLSVRESGGTIYLNFGRRWSEALTVTISKRQERIFTVAGMPPKQLTNRAVRVRGWIEERNGPRIEANRPEQIEVAGLN